MNAVNKAPQTETPITDAVSEYLNEIEQYRTKEPGKYLAGLRLLADTVENALAN